MFTGKIGIAGWEISCISSIVALSLFVHAGKQDFHHVDIRICNALFIVFSVLHLVVGYNEVASERSWLMPAYSWNINWAAMSIVFAKAISYTCKIFKLEESEINIEQDIKHKIRKWSESICPHNLISYCWKERPRVISRLYRPTTGSPDA